MDSTNIVLTLTPVYTDTPVVYDGTNGTAGTGTADINLSITYAGGAVMLFGDNEGDALGLFTEVTNVAGANISGDVQITSSLDD